MEALRDTINGLNEAEAAALVAIVAVLSMFAFLRLMDYLSRDKKAEMLQLRIMEQFAAQNQTMQETLKTLGENVATQNKALIAMLKQNREDAEQLDSFRREVQTTQGATLERLTELAKHQRDGFERTNQALITVQESVESVREVVEPLRGLNDSAFQLRQDISDTHAALMQRAISLSDEINRLSAQSSIRMIENGNGAIPLADRESADNVSKPVPETADEVKNG